MIHLPTFYRPFFVVFSFCFLLFSSNSVLAETLIDTTSLSNNANRSCYAINKAYALIDTREIDYISTTTLQDFNNGYNDKLVWNLLTLSDTVIASSTYQTTSTGLKNLSLSINQDVSSYDYVKLVIFNQNSGSSWTACFTLSYSDSQSPKYPLFFESKLVSMGTNNTFASNASHVPRIKIEGTAKEDDCPVCEICDYDDDIPYGVPFLNDVTMVTGYTESYDASTSEMLTIEKKYYHIPAVAIFFLSTVVIIVMSRLIAELLKRISKK